jgi:2,4-dienoyl-CoA reductase-like NADH-dependent reductase (Old Yellow Enzyme family)/predicted alpha/beta hydrolase
VAAAIYRGRREPAFFCVLNFVTRAKIRQPVKMSEQPASHPHSRHTTACEPATMPVVVDDGARYELLFVEPAGEWKQLLYWIPAMGMPARHYLPLAQALSARGVAVVLHEWRGIGSSNLRAGRNCDWSYRQLLQQDLAAGLAVIRQRWPRANLLVGGHSLGGQLSVLFAAMHPSAFEGLVLVASGAPYWRRFRFGALLALAYAAAPLLARLVGYLPGRRIGFGGNEARGVISDWARSGRSGRYRASGLQQDLEHALGTLALPTLALRLRDDWFGPQPSLDWLLAKMPLAGHEVEVLFPQDLAGAPADHFSWMKRPEPLAARITAWLHRRGALLTPENPAALDFDDFRLHLQHSLPPEIPMHLFDPFTQRGLTLRNRLVVSPMCEYSATDGVPDDWHLVHLGSRAVGGAGAVIAEATAISATGRISPQDTGIWNQAQVDAWQPITRFIKAQGAAAGVQLAHAGRKASTLRPWDGHGAVPSGQGDWSVVAPSALPFDTGWNVPQALDDGGIAAVIDDFRSSALRSLEAGFNVVEIHAAHGYLLHQFLSPLSNHRDDGYGGSFDNRTRLLREVVIAVREVWPAELPLWVRISATDWAPEDGPRGWDVEQSVQLAQQLKALGVDLIDASSGGLIPHAKIPLGPGYQVAFAAQIRREADIATGAVGLITEPHQAEDIVAQGQADLVLMARESLRDPYFPRRAAKVLGAEIVAPVQYQRAW